MTVFTVIVLIPFFDIFLKALTPNGNGFVNGDSLTLDNFRVVFAQTNMLRYLMNSVIVSIVTSAVAVLIGAPAGYVISRSRSRLVSGYSLLLFVIQSLPVIVFVVPLFIMFSSVGLVDDLPGLVIVYVSSAIPIGCWMMSSYFDTIPHSLEEAAWVDGATLFGGFWRIILPNSLPGVMSVAIFSFLASWNDYLVALVFLRSDAEFTLPIGIQQFFQENQVSWGPVMASAVLMLAPPTIVFAVFRRYFSIGGIGGALAGT
ncbi:carbohydrate ABC transporter permease [Actinacidiphila oryziradicis]|nr:carbohydrate ABC transporter permease [Actinacidiphila oryziradicis]